VTTFGDINDKKPADGCRSLREPRHVGSGRAQQEGVCEPLYAHASAYGRTVLRHRTVKPHAQTRAYLVRASRSASSSQAVTARNVSSRAGTPFGKSAFSSSSRLTVRAPSEEELRVLLVLAIVRRVFELRPLIAVLAVVVRRPLRPRLAVLFAPAMPWAAFRCAPNAAGRVNVRPHSGQVNSSAAVAVAFSALFALARAMGHPPAVGCIVPNRH
jgi:hypothetical protein